MYTGYCSCNRSPVALPPRHANWRCSSLGLSLPDSSIRGVSSFLSSYPEPEAGPWPTPRAGQRNARRRVHFVLALSPPTRSISFALLSLLLPTSRCSACFLSSTGMHGVRWNAGERCSWNCTCHAWHVRSNSFHPCLMFPSRSYCRWNISSCYCVQWTNSSSLVCSCCLPPFLQVVPALS